MNLSDYTTPKTDGIMSRCDTFDCYQDLVQELANSSRDLERKLAKCRDFLSGIAIDMESDGNHHGVDTIKEFLKETEP